MKQIVGRMLMVVGLAATTALTGCHKYRDLVDTCYPDRYRYQAHLEVNEAFAPQVSNGHVLDQTVWNHHFKKTEDGVPTAELTPSGRLHLDYLARRRPRADTLVFLQTANDVRWDPKDKETYVKQRQTLDAGRVEAVRNYLNNYTVGRGLSFHVEVHDPGQTGKSAIGVDNAVRQLQRSTVSGLTGGGGGGSVSGGGGAAPAVGGSPVAGGYGGSGGGGGGY